MTTLHLRFLGVPEVILDGVPVVLSRRSSLALLAYLAVSGGTHPRELLTALFGGDGSDEQARRRLSNALADLRQHLAPCLLSSWHVVGMQAGLRCTSDVQAFSDLLAQAREHDDVQALRAAAEMYKGEFLAGLSLAGAPDFEMWLLLNRESYHAQFVQTLEELVASAMRRSAWSDGAWAAQRLVQLEPWHEEAHRQLMTFLARSGQRHLAMAQFDICRRLLREELDTEPSDETVAVFDGLRHGTGVANNLPAQPTACLGRDGEIDLLTRQLAARESRLISVVGPSGSGKTRLALEVAATFARGDQAGVNRSFADGVFLVNARGVPADRLPGEIARTLGLGLAAGCQAAQIGARLSQLSVLPILDGLENTPAMAQVLRELLASGLDSPILVTAEAALRVDGEHVLSIGGLDLPARPEDLERAPAGALLLAEAQRADLRFKVAVGARTALVQICHLVHGLPLGLILAARALAGISSAALVDAIEAALTVPAPGARRAEPWWNSPQWASVLDTLEMLDRPSGLVPTSGSKRARRANPLAVLCTPDLDAAGPVERLRAKGMVVCVTHDLPGCVRIATAAGPDLVLIDPRLPRRLEQLLRAHPISSDASIQWLSEPAPALVGVSPAQVAD